MLGPVQTERFEGKNKAKNKIENELGSVDWIVTVSYTHLTLPTIYSV